MVADSTSFVWNVVPVCIIQAFRFDNKVIRPVYKIALPLFTEYCTR